MNVELHGGPCMELTWSKSSYSGAEGGDCVEVAACLDKVHIRDSKNITRPDLALAPSAWTVFIEFTREA
ncbi:MULTISPECIES: DUF397 domain-containing protein [Streptomyces]|uniref:DUF397 domain-containing protein n=1 Tax=Streptomyces flavovirens TaxID=52258 RepID=A0ABV8N579_9ACTN|nr:DUF397 domain-containing protein [Streptomyces sp. MBT51]MBK3596392.1 DUF397 domain-containing protein [Streptomyces sp. MBT51]